MLDPIRFIKLALKEDEEAPDMREIKDLERYFREFLGQENLMTASLIYKFHPDNCRSTLDNKARTLIGIAPAESPIAKALARDLNLFLYILNNINTPGAGIIDNDKNKDGIPDFIIAINPLLMDLKVKPFQTVEEL